MPMTSSASHAKARSPRVGIRAAVRPTGICSLASASTPARAPAPRWRGSRATRSSLHASARLLQRHDGWRNDRATGDSLVSANPWQVSTLGGTSQWLVGANWTGALQQSVIAEWWHDGTALSDAEWDAWNSRNAALVARGAQAGLPAGLLRGVGGNLAWQASPFAAQNLRRDSLFVRLAWQPDHWQFTLDALITPSDRGRIVTAGIQWQGDRLRINAAWRVNGGPATSVFAQLPQRQTGVIAASWAF
ncbi:MAG: hypothetical protein E6H65_09815 [Betaproteobacteria bacterium]|nr:MAG: hypothetical protein E6H65_09815 [Betaproteobacteria bacterium]